MVLRVVPGRRFPSKPFSTLFEPFLFALTSSSVRSSLAERKAERNRWLNPFVLSSQIDPG